MARSGEQSSRAPRLKLWHEITLVLAIKAITLYAIWWAWFAHPQDQRLDGAGVASSIVSPDSTLQPVPPLKEHSHASRPGTR